MRMCDQCGKYFDRRYALGGNFTSCYDCVIKDCFKQAEISAQNDYNRCYENFCNEMEK